MGYHSYDSYNVNKRKVAHALMILILNKIDNINFEISNLKFKELMDYNSSFTDNKKTESYNTFNVKSDIIKLFKIMQLNKLNKLNNINYIYL